MPHLTIQGETQLNGKVAISGAKNSALPLICAALLTDKILTLHNFPILTDTTKLLEILSELGAKTSIIPNQNGEFGSPQQLNIEFSNVISLLAVHEAVNQMRASILVLGPLLAREGQATITLPGGDAIGARPIDLHLKGLQKMGAQVEIIDGKVHSTAPKGGLNGAHITFPFISVGASEHLMLTAALANGETILENVALEPEITDLAHLLQKMGVPIEGIGTSTLQIQGKNGVPLTAASHHIIADRIEAASFVIAAIATKGDVTLTHINPILIKDFLDILSQNGANIAIDGHQIKVTGAPEYFKPLNIETAPFPGFATDIQAQLMALLCLVDGKSYINELIFENRFMHATEYQKMGANIDIQGARATIHGGAKLRGTDIAASDIRACFGLVIAALAAQGETVLRHIYHLDRGYESFEQKFAGLGAVMKRYH
ncbi:MAG: UDP-N-acetylglucosamine 1-carboxyvinyltransferase [Alphaproteobacteria bacterium]|nr:UDP-N-acetylglucosamine 1-carboxyvinyltransferase [Alphaproteobacteria bacterium]